MGYQWNRLDEHVLNPCLLFTIMSLCKTSFIQPGNKHCALFLWSLNPRLPNPAGTVLIYRFSPLSLVKLNPLQRKNLEAHVNLLFFFLILGPNWWPRQVPHGVRVQPEAKHSRDGYQTGGGRHQHGSPFCPGPPSQGLVTNSIIFC